MKTMPMAAAQVAESEASSPLRKKIVIVGGGIAGLYCARQLAAGGKDEISVLELRNEFGGRIETGDMRGFIEETTATRPAFKAEFGPMRFELELQRLFATLCAELGITFSDFTPPKGQRSPVPYPLQAAECERDGRTPLSPLQLLKLGVFRMFGKQTKIVAGEDGDEVALVEDDTNAGWLRRLQDDLPAGDADAFEHLRAHAKSATGRLLYDMGFSNALSEVLSPLAVKMIEDEGTFYALLPRNPSAVEWGIFWLRLFKLGKKPLSTIPGGVRMVTERLQAQLETTWREKVCLHLRQKVIAVNVWPSDETCLAIEVLDQSKRSSRHYTIVAEQVILALPKAPLKDLASTFPTEVQRALDQVDGFPLLKVFLCGRVPPWWPTPGTPLPQERAWNMMTREVHYFRDESDLNAMTLLYMDSPASQYWAQYVQAPDNHDHAEYRGNPWLRAELVRSLVENQRTVADAQIPKPDPALEIPVDATDRRVAILLRLLQAIEYPRGLLQVASSMLEAWHSLSLGDQAVLALPSSVASTVFAGVSDYAIRDWSRMPFGAGCHAWRPGSHSWEIRRALRAFALPGSRTNNVHVCGEAYSDYQGFIEGSLRSAREAVDSTLGGPPTHRAL
jgi:hypothetical protein